MKKFIVLTTVIIQLISSEILAASIPTYSSMYMYDNQDCYTDLDTTNQNQISDPFYVINKQIFYFNWMLDTIIIIPAMQIYTTAIPKRGRNHISNFINNISEPVNLANQLFQGKFAEARVTFGRFITNSLLGFFGIMDVASEFNLKYYGEDFGQTLAHYKAPMGPYIVIPILGPSTLRDTAGKVVDFAIDPFEYILNKEAKDAVNITWAMQKRVDADVVIKTIKSSLDPYETAKQIYIQNRIKQIQGQ